MAIINPLAPVSGLLGGVTGALNSLRKPSLKGQDFASVLNEKVRTQNDPGVLRMQAAKAREDADKSARQFLKVRDSNNDQMLSKDESGLDAKKFQQIDLNGDGKLTLDEIRKPSLDAIARMYPGSTTHA